MGRRGEGERLEVGGDVRYALCSRRIERSTRRGKHDRKTVIVDIEQRTENIRTTFFFV